MKHHLTLYRYLERMHYRFYSWCSCGWHATYEYTTATGAHLAFGQHLVRKENSA